MIKRELQNNNKAIGTEVKRKDDFFNRERTTFHRTGSNTEAHTQLERLDFVKTLDVESTAIKPATMISQSKVEDCPGSQIDDLKEPMATMKGELQSNLTKEILDCTKKRVPKKMSLNGSWRRPRSEGSLGLVIIISRPRQRRMGRWLKCNPKEYG